MNPEFVRQYLEYYQDLGVKTLYKRAAKNPAEAAEAAKNPPGTPRASLPPVEPTQPQECPQGDFSPSDRPSAETTLDALRREIGPDCRRCKLHAQRTQVVFGVGDPQARLVFVGEGPGADEDAQGIPFVGRAGQLLTQMIEGTAKREGIPLLRKDVYICNVVKCRPPGNRTPEADEMEICGQFLFRQIEAIHPKAICVLGGTAAKALLDRKDGVTRLRGNWYQWHNYQVMVTYHPSYLLRQYNQEAKREAWEDLKKVLHYVYD